MDDFEKTILKIEFKKKKIVNFQKKPAFLIQDSSVIKEAFTNSDVCTVIPEIIYLLENCLKICCEYFCKFFGSVIKNHIYNKTTKSDSIFHEVQSYLF